jgi:hypothetical protein
MAENLNRRKFLSIATSLTSAVGGIFAVGAFVSTFQQGKKAKALGASIPMVGPN